MSATEAKTEVVSEAEAPANSALGAGDAESQMEHYAAALDAHMEAFIARGKAFLAEHLGKQAFRANPAFEDLHALGEGILRFLVHEQRNTAVAAQKAYDAMQGAMQAARDAGTAPPDATQPDSPDGAGASSSQGGQT